jgi:phage shock protein PspC (stress-responsive transcriptional regulator)
VSTERFLTALILAGVPAGVAVALSPPNVYARTIVALGAFVASLPAAYLLSGARS